MLHFQPTRRVEPVRLWAADRPAGRPRDWVARAGELFARLGNMLFFGVFTLVIFDDRDGRKPLTPFQLGLSVIMRSVLWLALIVVLAVFVIPGTLIMRLGKAWAALR